MCEASCMPDRARADAAACIVDSRTLGVGAQCSKHPQAGRVSGREASPVSSVKDTVQHALKKQGIAHPLTHYHIHLLHNTSQSSAFRAIVQARQCTS